VNVLQWLPAVTTAGVVLNGMRLRDRLSGLRRVRPADPRRPDEGRALVRAPGVELPAQVRAAALGHALRTGAEVLDLVPHDLPVERAMDLARSVDARRYADDMAGLGRGAGHATLVTADVLERARVAPGGYEAGEYAATTVRLKQYAKVAGLAVVPGPAGDPGCRRAWLNGLGLAPGLMAAGALASWALVLAGVVVAPVAGLVGLVIYSCVPYIVCAGGPLRPRDLHRAALLRMADVPLSWWRTWRAPRDAWERRRADQVEAARAYYREELAQGVERFLEPRRPDCPWCGSTDLSVHVRSRDIIQLKPGRFTLERCADCGHVFQNPRLTLDGLDFYYRDVYDGLGAEQAERVFSDQAGWYRARAETVRAVALPRTWLDVGTGHAHFCRTAATVLPATTFDGLDFSDGVDEAARRGWIREGFHGLFPELIDRLEGRYEVISMHHYLEHTRDPFAELDAAMKVLGPGGLLLIELPDPESFFGRLLRGWWIPWLPPQHQHMIPIENLKNALTARGMEIVAEERRGAQQGPDLPGAALVGLNILGPDPARPWAPGSPTLFGRVRRMVALTLLGPVLLAAFAGQAAIRPFLRSHSNAYRVLARKAAG
jgi:SAM-dependent methyltransferase